MINIRKRHIRCDNRTPTNGIGVPSTVITNTDKLGEREIKDDRLGGIWWEAPKSKTNKEEDIPEWLEDDKPIWEKADLACYVARNFWKCSNINGSNDGVSIVGFGWGGLYVQCWLPNFDEAGSKNHQTRNNNTAMRNQTKKQSRRGEVSK